MSDLVEELSQRALALTPKLSRLRGIRRSNDESQRSRMELRN
jgi:hypothetical protein